LSGIAGIFNRDGRPVASDLLARMTDAIAHRGPDGSAHWVDGAVGFGHQMLCTTPESLHEQQPWCDATGQLCLVLDGRVDNRAELQRALAAAGAHLRNDTDAELVLQSYEVWGEACPKRIIGDFAFAIWDARKQQLFCARDFLGIKPFYYYADEHTFRFGSELHQILEDESIRREPNEGMIGEYLANAITSQEEALYQGILRLPPAHSLIVGEGRFRKQRYWTPDFSKNIRYQTDTEYAEHFLAIFKESIRCRLRSIGSVGIALSGGLDSSSIACVAQSLYRDAGNAHPDFIALSEVFPGLACDESTYIQVVVDLWGLKSETIERKNVDSTLYSDQVRRYLDFPGYPNGGAADPVSGLAGERGLRVLLDGIGGDQWLTGSTFSYADLLSHLQISPLIRQVCSDVESIGVAQTLSHVLWYGITPLFPQRVRDAVKWILRKKNSVPPWINAEFSRRVRLDKRIRRIPGPTLRTTFAQRELWQVSTDGFGVHSYEIEERAASRLGFERRHPFQDQRLVEFAFALPEEQRRRQGWIKYILRTAMQDYLPETVQQRWDKAEFSDVFGRVLAGRAIARLFDTLAIVSLGWVDGQCLRDMYQKMSILYQHDDEEYARYVWKLWMIVGIELWYNRAFLNREALSAIGLHAGESDHEPALVVA